MSDAALGNLLVLQGGGPTPVLNTSLYGVIDEARRSGRFGRIFGARFGIEGLIGDDLIDLSSLPQQEMDRLRVTPGASLGTTRLRPGSAAIEEMLSVLRRREIHSVLLIGGNGSLRGAAAIHDAARAANADICVVGIPKTIDNDIVGTDRCPGFGSAARYLAQAVRDLGMDVRSLPQPVSIYETMGRSVGWLAGASVLAKIDADHAPHLVYLPEKSFSVDRFLGDIDRTVRRLGWAIAVVAEGLKNERGEPVFELSQQSQRDAMNRALPGGVAAYLADVVTQKLDLRCRSEKPGLCGRCSALHLSTQDLADAELVGRAGVRAAIERRSGCMVSLKPLAEPRIAATELISLNDCGGERLVPAQWLRDDAESPVTPDFVNYVRPIVGDLVDYAVPLKDQRQY
jgi:ATP-dependent phosphofructokinase / diphosphate-dependent phosphofructokinase